MKVVLDLTKLRDEGKISQSEYDKLTQYAAHETSHLAFNLLVSLGVIAVTCSSLALVPSPFTAILIGVLLSTLGLSPLRASLKWNLLAQICLLIGSLLLCGGILWLFEGSTTSWLIVTVLLASGGIIIRHGLLIVLSVLALSATIGSGTLYEHAMYGIIVEQPSVTILLFSFLSFITYRMSFFLQPDYQRLAIYASRTCVFLVNMGFWVGSLWGDQLPHHFSIPDWIFIVVWAISLIGVGVWAVHENRRWVVNTCAIFGAIHFYTQWFERLDTTPITVLLAGIIALFFAMGIQYLNTTTIKSNR